MNLMFAKIEMKRLDVILVAPEGVMMIAWFGR